MNYTPDQKDKDRLMEQFPFSETQPNTIWTSQLPTKKEMNLILNCIQLKGNKLI